MQVEAGKLRWNSTIADLFPELAEKMDTALKTVTLEQLLSHTSGIQHNEEFDVLLGKSMLQEGNLDEMRYGFCASTPRNLWCKPEPNSPTRT